MKEEEFTNLITSCGFRLDKKEQMGATEYSYYIKFTGYGKYTLKRFNNLFFSIDFDITNGTNGCIFIGYVLNEDEFRLIMKRIQMPI